MRARQLSARGGEMRCELNGDRVSGTEEESTQVFDQLEAVGVNLDEVWEVLETEGVDKFDKSWAELGRTVTDELERASIQAGGDR